MKIDRSQFIQKAIDIKNKVVHYADPRPDTTADTYSASEKSSAITGGLEAYYASNSVVGGLGGAVGGFVGCKVGKKTFSVTKALSSAFLSGAGAGALLSIGKGLAIEVMKGTAVSFSPAGVAIFSAMCGLSGVSGTLQGSCVGDIKDSGSFGMSLGLTASFFGGSKLLPLVGSLAGSASGMIKKDKKMLRVLTGAGVGLALGAVGGALQGPISACFNGAMGAVTGALAPLGGPKFAQFKRNLTADINKLFGKKLLRPKKELSDGKRIALGVAGGALSGLTTGMLVAGIIGSPVGLVLAPVIMGAVTGIKVAKTIRNQKKIPQYIGTVMENIRKMYPEEAIKNTDPAVFQVLTTKFINKYKDPEEFKKIDQKQFMEDFAGFNG